MKPWTTRLATIAGVSVMFASASGQQANPPAAPAQSDASTPSAKAQAANAQKPGAKQAPAKAGAQKSDKAKPDSDDSEPKPKLNTLQFGYTTWNSGGWLQGLHQNGLIQGGFVLDRLSLLSPYSHGLFSALDLSGVPGQDFGFRLENEFGSMTDLKIRASQFTFWDPERDVLLPSRDKAFSADLDRQIQPNWGAFVDYSYQENEHHFPPPLVQPHFTSQTVTIGTQKGFNGSNLQGVVSEDRYTDLSGTQPLTLTDRAALNYTADLTKKLTIDAATSVNRIQQQGLPQDSWVMNYAVGGILDLDGVSTLSAHGAETILNLTNVQNAYVRKRLDSGLNYNAYLNGMWLGAAFDHKEEERVRADHSAVDVPAWNDYNFKIDTRLGKQLKLNVKGDIDDLVHAPVFMTTDPTLLYWDRTALLAGKISGGNATNSAYVSYTYRYRRNADRDLELSWYSYALGASKVLSSKLLAYGEYESDQYSTGGASALDQQLSGYFPTSETFTAGLDYTPNMHNSVAAVINSFYTRDEWGQQIALTYSRDLGHDRNFQITYSPWLQRDRLYDVDSFDARILSVKLETRF